jgi:hypothetical protein
LQYFEIVYIKAAFILDRDKKLIEPI